MQHNQKTVYIQVNFIVCEKVLLHMATISLKLRTRLVVFAGFPLISEKKVILNTNEIIES